VSGEPGDFIARRDEVLELLYWLEGEGFGGDATLGGIARLVARDEPLVAETVAELEQRGDIARDAASGQYRLTPTGRSEAARRFAVEFAGMLDQGHGECNDPTCDCHTNPAGAAECHARAHGGHEH
jgi:hypothetical protein